MAAPAATEGRPAEIGKWDQAGLAEAEEYHSSMIFGMIPVVAILLHYSGVFFSMPLLELLCQRDLGIVGYSFS